MTVAAIIPTIGRPELVRAVRSVHDQTVPVLPIVVLDRPELAAAVESRLTGLPHVLITTMGGVGGAAARNLGVRAASRDVVAFLDDDDEWLPEKTRGQLSMLEDAPTAVVSSRALLVGKKTRVVPEQIYANEGSIADYLLDRSTIKLRKKFIQSSTLLMSRETAERVSWDERLPRHQDWSLLIELRRQQVEIVSHPDPLVAVHQGSVASVSRSTDWRSSEAWLDEYAYDASPRSKGDFLCSIVTRSAIAAGDMGEAGRILRRALPLRPHLSAVMVGVSEIVRKR